MKKLLALLLACLMLVPCLVACGDTAAKADNSVEAAADAADMIPLNATIDEEITE